MGEVIFNISRRNWGRQCALRVLETLPIEDRERFGLSQYFKKLSTSRSGF